MIGFKTCFRDQAEPLPILVEQVGKRAGHILLVFNAPLDRRKNILLGNGAGQSRGQGAESR